MRTLCLHFWPWLFACVALASLPCDYTLMRSVCLPAAHRWPFVCVAQIPCTPHACCLRFVCIFFACCLRVLLRFESLPNPFTMRVTCAQKAHGTLRGLCVHFACPVCLRFRVCCLQVVCILGTQHAGKRLPTRMRVFVCNYAACISRRWLQLSHGYLQTTCGRGDCRTEWRSLLDVGWDSANPAQIALQIAIWHFHGTGVFRAWR